MVKIENFASIRFPYFQSGEFAKLQRMKQKILGRLKEVGPGYELDKLPPAILKAVIETATPIIVEEFGKAEDRIVEKVITAKFVAKVIKTVLEGKVRRRSRSLEVERRNS